MITNETVSNFSLKTWVEKKDSMITRNSTRELDLAYSLHILYGLT